MGTGHIPTTAACESCHKSTTVFGPNTAMVHTGITSGCATCHATGKTFSGTPAVKTAPTNHVPIGVGNVRELPRGEQLHELRGHGDEPCAGDRDHLRDLPRDGQGLVRGDDRDAADGGAGQESPADR